jgi:hypothetical protein
VTGILEGVHQCANVFPDERVVHEFTSGLQPAISRVVKERLKSRPHRDSENIAVARQLAAQEGYAHRARMAEIQKMVTVKPTRGKAFTIGEMQTPVISVQAYETPEHAGWGTLEPYQPPQPVFEVSPLGPPPERFVGISHYTNSKVPDDPLGLSYSLGDAVHIFESLEPILAIGMLD